MSVSNLLTLDKLKESLDFNQLEGWEAQKLMAPKGRLNMNTAHMDLSRARVAAVIFLIYEEDGQLKFPVTLRNPYDGVHSNQVSLPGGKIEGIDSSLEATAIRECNEEIGAKPEAIEILGKLTELYIPPSNFIVHPFVGYYHHQPDFVPCDIEVQQIITIPLDDFVQFKTEIFSIANAAGIVRDVPAFNLENDIKIWGATAMIINEFRLLVKKSLNL